MFKFINEIHPYLYFIVSTSSLIIWQRMLGGNGNKIMEQAGVELCQAQTSYLLAFGLLAYAEAVRLYLVS